MPVDSSPSFQSTTSTGLSKSNIHMPSWEHSHRSCLSVTRFHNRTWISWLFRVSSSSNTTQLRCNNSLEGSSLGALQKRKGSVEGIFFVALLYPTANSPGQYESFTVLLYHSIKFAQVTSLKCHPSKTTLFGAVWCKTLTFIILIKLRFLHCHSPKSSNSAFCPTKNVQELI